MYTAAANVHNQGCRATAATVFSNTGYLQHISHKQIQGLLTYLFPLRFHRRILECEKQPGIAGDKVPVEIWDVSGDQA